MHSFMNLNSNFVTLCSRCPNFRHIKRDQKNPFYWVEKRLKFKDREINRQLNSKPFLHAPFSSNDISNVLKEILLGLTIGYICESD